MDTEEQTVWVNIYNDFVGNRGSAHTTREVADIWCQGRIACVEVKFKPGQGLHEDELKGIKW